jgi:hypothetical protein
MELIGQTSDVPQASEILSGFTTKNADSRATNTILRLSRKLCEHNLRQWKVEDQSRRTDVSNKCLVKLNREIDTMNSIRAELVDEINEWVIRNMHQDRNAPVHTETLGSVVDRLCIAWVRVQQLREKETAHQDSDQGLHGSQRAAQQMRELGAAYDILVAEVTSGQRQIPDWRSLKSYGKGQDN